MKPIEEVIRNSTEENQEKVDWTKAWSTKYPVLAAYQQEVDIPKYAAEIRRMLTELQADYGYSEQDAMLVLKDILAHEYMDNRPKKAKKQRYWRGINMENEKVFAMSFSKVYGLLTAKAERKGRSRAEVDQVTSWLTGYTMQQIEALTDREITYGDFFRQAPEMNPNREKITGVVCGVRVENIEDPLMREIRYLDKLVDELARGKAMEKILRK